ncbi:MAG: peptidylprolyl isomerase [Verrucomicrobiota bacterium]
MTLLAGPKLNAQIYADVAVSQGDTSLGTFRILLYHEIAPKAVANFIGLANGERNWIDPNTGSLKTGVRYYDDLIFHRLIHNFVIQGGDPLGTGAGGPGYIFQDEFEDTLSHSGSYVVSMANSGANTNGSQFFITLEAATFLDKKHTIFGLVIDDATYPNSTTLIDGFKNSTNFPTGLSDAPLTSINIDTITISGPSLAAFDSNAHDLPVVGPVPDGIRISHNNSAETFALAWAANAKFDYPLYRSTDLTSWSLAGNVLTMDTSNTFEVDITAIATGDKTFYQTAQVDYSNVIDAPQDVLANGTILEFEPDGGTLRLTFNGAGGGTWEFIYNDSITPTESGNITSVSQTNTNSIPTIPTTGTFISGQTFARFLSIRQITVFFDNDAGPDQLTAIQPILSFHTTTTGWFDGPFNTNSTSGNITFIGPFSYTAP